MPFYLLNVYNLEAREALIELDDLSLLLQEGLFVEAEDETKAREYATKHHNTLRSDKTNTLMTPEELEIRSYYHHLWQGPNLSSIKEIASG